MKSYQQLLDEGERLVESGDPVSGARTYAEAARREPDRKEAYTKLGLVYRQSNDADGAMSFFAQAARLDETDAFVRFNLGLIQYGEGMLDAARQSLEEAIAIVQRGVAGARVEAEAMKPDKQNLLLHQCHELEETVADANMLLAEIAAHQEARPNPETRAEDAA